MIEQVTSGPARTRQKFNEIIDRLNALDKSVGDDFLHRGQLGPHAALHFSPETFQPYIPRRRRIASTSIGLLAWYQFNGNANDSSSGGHNGTFVGGMTAPYNVGEFDGSDDYVTCGDDFLGTGALTIMGWIRPTAFGSFPYYAQTIVDNTKVKFETTGSDDRLRFSSDGSTYAYSANNSITLHELQHVAVTRDVNGVANFYINAVLSGTADQASGTPVAGTTVVVSHPVTTFSGAIDDVRIYNSVKPVYQIRQAMDERERGYFHTNQVFGAATIFEVQSAGTGDGIYNCYEQTIDATEWADTAGDSKVDNRNTTSTEVFNLAEFDPEAEYVAQLASGDLLLSVRYWDDESNVRWVGIPFRQGAHGAGVRLAYCSEAAPADNTIGATLDHTTGTAIIVTCHICGGSALNAAVPRLADNDEIFVVKIGATWYCTTTFQASEDCDCYEA